MILSIYDIAIENDSCIVEKDEEFATAKEERLLIMSLRAMQMH